MKRQVELDLTAEQTTLADQIDAWFGRQATLRYPLAALHAAKARLAAREGDPHPSLVQEATVRAMPVGELRSAILARSADQDAGLMSLDEQRLAAKADVTAATTGQQLAAIRARLA